MTCESTYPSSGIVGIRPTIAMFLGVMRLNVRGTLWCSTARVDSVSVGLCGVQHVANADLVGRDDKAPYVKSEWRVEPRGRRSYRTASLGR